MTRLQKMAKNVSFCPLDHSKMDFCDFWMILRDLVRFPNVEKHLILSPYAISSRSKRPNSRKWPKTSILALWIIQKCVFVIFEWSSMSDIIPKLLRPFSTMEICNIKSIRPSKLEKLTKDWMDHAKQPTRRTKNFLKNQPDFSRTCGFRGEFRERLNFHFKTSNVTNQWLDFRQNRLKVEKPQKTPFLTSFYTYWRRQYAK